MPMRVDHLPMPRRLARGLLSLSGALAAVAATAALPPTAVHAADPPSPKLALSFKPVHKSAQIDIPDGDEVDECRVKVERRGKSSGWVVYGPAGQMLRRFVDTDGDNVVDQWQYFFQGLEVYRDIDSNNNNKVDQSRWLNTGGTRWGIDNNEDGRIDEWRILSAEEAARVAVEALLDGDAAVMKTLLVTEDDLRKLGIKAELAEEIRKNVAQPEAAIRQIRSKSRVLGPKTQWMRFDSANPGLIPASEGKAAQDLIVYENAMGIVEVDGKAALVQIGEMIRLGDVWKLTQIPQPLDADSNTLAAGGVLMQPATVIPDAGGNIIAGGLNEQQRKLLADLQDIDSKAPSPSASAKALADYNSRRADVLDQLIEASSTEQEREQWLRQLVDGLAAAVQTGQYPGGLARLQQINQKIQKDDGSKELRAYVAYRALLSQYANDLQAAINNNERRQEVQTWWLTELEKFATAYAGADEAADAVLQLAISNEFVGQIDKAKQWYEQAAKTPNTDAGQRAAGALRRLSIEGQRLELTGARIGGGKVDVADYRGKPVLVIFWSTWAKPATEDLPQIKALYDQYRSRGFEIVGVNLDASEDAVRQYLNEYRMPWPQIYEEGGLESAPAKQFGIISLPTMFLVNKRGEVVNRNITVTDLKNELPRLLLE